MTIRIRKVDDNAYSVDVSVQVSKTLFAWIVGTQGKVKIRSPRKVLDEFNNFVMKINPNDAIKQYQYNVDNLVYDNCVVEVPTQPAPSITYCCVPVLAAAFNACSVYAARQSGDGAICTLTSLRSSASGGCFVVSSCGSKTALRQVYSFVRRCTPPSTSALWQGCRQIRDVARFPHGTPVRRRSSVR